MKPHFIVLALIACGAGLSALATWQVQSLQPQSQSLQQPAAAPIDLVALQQQADAALENLRQAQLGRQVSATAMPRRYSLVVSEK